MTTPQKNNLKPGHSKRPDFRLRNQWITHLRSYLREIGSLTAKSYRRDVYVDVFTSSP